jgi:hypothetical protein
MNIEKELNKELKPLCKKHYCKKGEPYFDGTPLNIVVNKITQFITRTNGKKLEV